MQYRELGRTGIQVSTIGFGAWGIGGLSTGSTSYGDTDDAVSIRALEAALELGINFVDTANVYGDGHSETVIGQAFKGKRDKVVISTKAGLAAFGQPGDYSVPALETSLKESLKRMQTDYVDLFYIYTPPPGLVKEPGEILDWLLKMRQEGTIRAFGVSARSPDDGKEAILSMNPDAIQVNLNLLDQRLIDCGLDELAVSKGVSLIARTPLSFGFLSGAINADTVFDERDHRSCWPRSQVAHWAAGAEAMLTCRDEEMTPVDFALRYCISHDAVTCAIPGIINPEEATMNAAVSDAGALSPSALACIRKVYEENDRFSLKAKIQNPAHLERPKDA